MRVQPAWWIGVTIYLIYNAIIFTVWAIGGVSYLNSVGSDVAFKSLILPFGLGAGFIVLTLSYLGWWGPVMTEERRGSPGWVLWVVLAFMLAYILIFFAATNWHSLAAGHLMLLIVGGALVGFNEEVLTRGILVVGWRGSTPNEAWVWFWATLLFGLLHLPNAFFGLGLVDAAIQVVFTFLFGTGQYIIRRLGGTLLIPVAFHGAWNFVSDTVQASEAEQPAIGIYFAYGTGLLSILLVILVLLADRKARTKGA
jgi:uncharacterized protein